MTDGKQVKCSSCGQPIKTAFGTVGVSSAPLLCRRCFGEESYGGSERWGYGATIQGRGVVG